jgi:GNAT superfamily N-acetyltransferase
MDRDRVLEDRAMSATVFRVERFASGDGATEAFAELGQRVNGAPDGDPIPADGECWIALRAGEPIARLSTSLATDLREAPGVSGLIGHYEAVDTLAGSVLLRNAAEELVQNGARRVLGPINGSTWHRYRLALPALAGDPPFHPPVFLSEPRNPPEYVAQFESVGFKPLAFYESRIESPILTGGDDLRQTWTRLGRHGYTLRTLDASRFDEEMRAFWELSLVCFADNAFYSPIGFEEFLSLYQPLRSRIDPDLVLLVHDAGRHLVGYMLGYADALSDTGRGPTRVVAKTVAVSPDARGRGLGAALMMELRARAAKKGFTAAIDALIHLSNVSRRISMKLRTRVFRRYALYQWTP